MTMDRRSFVKLLGAFSAVAGLAPAEALKEAPSDASR
jgi:hypothetical protein